MIPHSKTPAEVLQEVQSDVGGLTQAEAEARLAKNGKNELAQGKKKTLFQKLIAQFKDVMIIVLIVAAVVSATIAIVQKEYGELIDAGIILLIVIVNAIIGLVQEGKAEAAMESLKSLSKPYSKVLRDGHQQQVKSEELVVGDVVKLEAGDIVPADIRLIDSASMKIEEAALTGESVPSDKDYSLCFEEDAALGDRCNMAYSTGIVAYGRGSGVVVATGMDTEVGKIATMLTESEEQTTPLQKQLAKTAKLLSIMVLAIAAVIFVASLIRKTPLIEAFMTAVAIAVAAIPEGLPAVVTIVLAIGVQRMSKRNAIIKALPAVETLGCCEVICSDKTGTITLNQMTVKAAYTADGGVVTAEQYDASKGTQEVLLRAMTLCNDSQEMDSGVLGGDPTETALVYFARTKGIVYADLVKAWRRVDEKPFDSDRKLMTTVNEKDGVRIAHIKGAPDILLNKCQYILDGEQVRAMTDEDRQRVISANVDMAKQALRVLGVAVKFENLSIDEVEDGVCFVGLVGMIDPPRKEVIAAVKVCFEAGMRPIMITGDHKDTAAAIAKEVGILREGDKVMLGAELDKLTDEEYEKVFWEYSVYARVSPQNKVRIVEAFKAAGKIVAMTGDGVNDAPSIKRSDIGIGMGITGTDVSKGAADMVLVDDNFATIVGAVEEGRKIYSNIKKAIQFLLSANIAEVLCLFITTVFLGVKFLTPVMILWVNLVTDSLPALALGMEEAEGDVMRQPPRKSHGSLFAGKTGSDIFIQGIMQTILVLGSFFVGDAIAEHPTAMTMAFVSLCLIQLFHSYNLRSQTHSILNKHVFNNKSLNYAFIIGVVLIASVVVFPFMNTLFSTVALNGVQWLIAIGFAVMVVPMVELQKVIEFHVKKSKDN